MTASEFMPFKFELDEPVLPISEEVLRDEIPDITAAQQQMEAESLWAVRYWNNAYPVYRWHQLLMQASRNHKGHKNGGRVAILHLAVYDATVEVWEHKQAHFRKAAYHYDQRVKKLGAEPEYSSSLCEWSAAAGAAHQVIGYYFPEQQAMLEGSVQSPGRSILPVVSASAFDASLGRVNVLGQQQRMQAMGQAMRDNGVRSFVVRSFADDLDHVLPADWACFRCAWAVVFRCM